MPVKTLAQTINNNPWDKAGISIGGFLTDLDSSVKVGSGVGIEVDAEKLLGLNSDTTVFRSEAYWRFSKNRRHRWDLSWFALRRAGSRSLANDIEIEGPNDTRVEIPAGTHIDTEINLDIIQTNYSYSFLQDDRLDIAVKGGFYVMPIKLDLDISGVVNEKTSQNFTAPLPVFGLRMDFALTPKWILRSGTQAFYAEYQNFKGSLFQTNTAIEYNPWNHVGFGLGYDNFLARLESDGNDVLQLDGLVEFHYKGLQFYTRISF